MMIYSRSIRRACVLRFPTPDAPMKSPETGPPEANQAPFRTRNWPPACLFLGQIGIEEYQNRASMVHGIGHLIGEIQMHLTIYGILVSGKACIAERGHA